MGFISKYPYTDFHELNLDWILSTIKDVEKEVDDFTVFNTITWAGEWSAAKSYVKWAIVQDSDGNGYISTQAVPVNVPLTNENYWTKIANYDVLYHAFNQRIEDNASLISQNSKSIESEAKQREDADNSLKSEFESADNSLRDAINKESGERNKIDTQLGTEISEINTKITPYYIFIGDSYAVESVTGTNRWPVSLANLLGLSSDQYTISAEGSTGFVGITADTWLTLLNNAKPATQNVTHIIIAGGANDANASESALTSAISTFMNRVKELYPRATVYLANIAYNSSTYALNKIFYNVTSAYEKIRNYGGVFLPYTNYCILDKSLLKNDGVHPIYNGIANSYIAQAIYNALKSTYTRTLYKEITFKPASTVKSVSYLNVYEFCTNNVLGYEFIGDTRSSAPLPYSFPVEFNQVTNIAKQTLIGTLDSDFPCAGGQNISCACMFGYRNPYPQTPFIPGKLIVSNNSVFINLAYQSTESNFTPALNAVTVDIFPCSTIIFPYF